MRVSVTLPGGDVVDVSAKPGGTVMEALRAAGVPVRAECGGAMACATCHVVIGEEWIERVGHAGDEEADLLDESEYMTTRSRLACQIITAQSLDGLQIALQLDAFEG